MQISKRIYQFLARIKEIVSRRFFKVIFSCILIFFLFFGSFNAYALSISPNWSGTKTFFNFVSGLSGEALGQDNWTTRGGGGALNFVWLALTHLMGDSIVEEEPGGGGRGETLDIPPDLRSGLMGLTNEASVLAYRSYPDISVSNHLAKNWVPGYDPVASGVYAADEVQSGYQALMDSGIGELWAKVLNLSYLFFVLIMIIAGFMIMFRHKLGGQAVVTIGNVLPRVIIYLILATFSFAIAGLIIDFVGILNGIVAYVLGGEEVKPIYGLAKLMVGSFGGKGPFDAVKNLWDTVKEFQHFGIWSKDTGVGLLHRIAVWLIETTKPGKLVLGFWAISSVVVVLGIAVLGAIRVTIMLFKSYFSMLLSVILAPIQITLAAIPGNSQMLKNWFFSLLRNSLVFPVVLFIVNIPNVIEDTTLMVSLPAKLVYDSAERVAIPDAVDIARILELFLRIFVLFYAAQAPKFLEAVFPPSTPEAFGAGMQGAKVSMSKIPLYGRFFREKKR